jgi:HptB-dependent secretion and biofilm anti anti-sigma factor
MQINISSYGRSAVVHLEGNFVFDCHKQLREACGPLVSDTATQVIQIELSEVDYLDSSALGMMLLIKEKAERAGKSIQIKGAQGIVLQVLEVAKFDVLFMMN